MGNIDYGTNCDVLFDFFQLVILFEIFKSFLSGGGEGVVGGELSYCERAGFLIGNIA